MDLKQLLSGVENSEEIISQIKSNLENEGVELLFDDGEDNIYIPKTRLDKEIAKRKTIDKQKKSLEKDLKTTKKEVKDNEELLEQLETTKKERDEIEKKLQKTEENTAIEKRIMSFDRKPHDMEDVIEKLDRDIISVSDGEVKGVESQLKDLIKDKEYLFKPVEGGTGKPGSQGKSNGDDTTPKKGELGKKLAQRKKGNTKSDDNNVYGLV